jgi:predicted DNA-binding protein
MPKYAKKIQVLLTEEQYKDLEEIASQQKKKFGTLVREAIEEYHLKKKKEREIAEAADRILSLPEVPAPENWEEYEKELARAHGFHE